MPDEPLPVQPTGPDKRIRGLRIVSIAAAPTHDPRREPGDRSKLSYEIRLELRSEMIHPFTEVEVYDFVRLKHENSEFRELLWRVYGQRLTPPEGKRPPYSTLELTLGIQIARRDRASELLTQLREASPPVELESA